MAKAINLRVNQARAAVASDIPGKFNEGKGLAEQRQHPTDTHRQGAHHTSDDGVRPAGE